MSSYRRTSAGAASATLPPWLNSSTIDPRAVFDLREFAPYGTAADGNYGLGSISPSPSQAGATDWGPYLTAATAAITALNNPAGGLYIPGDGCRATSTPYLQPNHTGVWGAGNSSCLTLMDSCTFGSRTFQYISQNTSATAAAPSVGVNVSTYAGSGVLTTSGTITTSGTNGFQATSGPAGSASLGTLQVATSTGTATITYTGISGATFTGCTTISGTGTVSGTAGGIVPLGTFAFRASGVIESQFGTEEHVNVRFMQINGNSTHQLGGPSGSRGVQLGVTFNSGDATATLTGSGYTSLPTSNFRLLIVSTNGAEIVFFSSRSGSTATVLPAYTKNGFNWPGGRGWENTNTPSSHPSASSACYLLQDGIYRSNEASYSSSMTTTDSGPSWLELWIYRTSGNCIHTDGHIPSGTGNSGTSSFGRGDDADHLTLHSAGTVAYRDMNSDGCHSNMHIGSCGFEGIYAGGGSMRWAGTCKVYYSGSLGDTTRSAGWNVSGSISTVDGSAQDCGGPGFYITADYCTMNVLSDSNGTNGTASTWLPNGNGIQLQGAQQNTIRLLSKDRHPTNNPSGGVDASQNYAVGIGTSCFGNDIRVVSYGTHAGAVTAVNSTGTALVTGSTGDNQIRGNSIRLNAADGQQSVAPGASYTPDPSLGETILVSVTAALALNEPKNFICYQSSTDGNASPCFVGQKIRFIFVQDGTGHVVTPNAVYAGVSVNPAANSTTVVTVECTASGGGAGTWTTVSTPQQDVQSFTSSGTWTKPPNVNTNSTTEILCIGGGGPGGSGASLVAASVPTGGGGGGGGGWTRIVVPTSALSATETVTVAAQTSGASGATAGNGATGSAGGNTTFGSKVAAGGGGAGGGGSNGAIGAAGATGSALIAGGPGQASSATGAAGTNGTGASGCPGGGSGGGVTSGGSQSAGGNGSRSNQVITSGGAATGGTAGGGTGGTGADSPTLYGPGSSGAGGGSASAGTGGPGGPGGRYGAGGGGGGACDNTHLSGAGGAGAAGLCLVITSY